MSGEYSIKVNRRDGALEVTAPEREWVDAKLSELSDVYSVAVDNELRRDDPAAENHGTRRTSRRATGGARRAPEVESTDSAAPRRRRRNTSRPQRNSLLEGQLTQKHQDALLQYIAERRAAFDKKATNNAVIIANYLADELDWPGVDVHDIYTVHRVLSLDGPNNYRSMLKNAYSRDKYFRGVDDGKYVLSVRGEKFARRESRDDFGRND